MSCTMTTLLVQLLGIRDQLALAERLGKEQRIEVLLEPPLATFWAPFQPRNPHYNPLPENPSSSGRGFHQEFPHRNPAFQHRPQLHHYTYRRRRHMQYQLTSAPQCPCHQRCCLFNRARPLRAMLCRRLSCIVSMLSTWHKPHFETHGFL